MTDKITQLLLDSHEALDRMCALAIDLSAKLQKHDAEQKLFMPSESGMIFETMKKLAAERDERKAIGKTTEEQLEDMEASFDLRWKADMRAIKMWQEAGPDRERTWPDHADLVVWLLDRLDERDKVINAMNGISLHQTDRGFEPVDLGGMKIRQHVHPLTCGNDSNHYPLYPYWNEAEGRLELICRDCDYTQTNAAMWSVTKEKVDGRDC